MRALLTAACLGLATAAAADPPVGAPAGGAPEPATAAAPKGPPAPRPARREPPAPSLLPATTSAAGGPAPAKPKSPWAVSPAVFETAGSRREAREEGASTSSARTEPTDPVQPERSRGPLLPRPQGEGSAGTGTPSPETSTPLLPAAAATPAAARTTTPATGGTRATPGPSATPPPLPGAAPPPAERNAFHGRLDLSQAVSDDNDSNRHLVWTDLRVTLDASRVSAADLWFRVDGRLRLSWTAAADNRLQLTDVYLRQGSPESTWRFTLGRQTIRPVGSAQVDGLSVERTMAPGFNLLAFAGLMPHPMTNLPNLDFTTAGVGYDLAGATSQHSGGVVLSLYHFGLDRLYLTHRTTLLLGPSFTATAFVIADVFQPEGLVPLSGGAGLDLTSALLLLRYRPVKLLDLSLSASHTHTIVPGLWWRDWMQEELRLRGFVLDGIEPVGTRVTSTRFTANLNLSREVVPFVRLRLDVRHTESALGLEALGGVKLRPGKLFVLAQGGWRQYFAAQVATVCADVGYEAELAGAQGGGSALRRTSLTGADARFVFEVHVMGWADASLVVPAAKGVMVSLQYQGLLDSGFLYHMGFVQIGYRF